MYWFALAVTLLLPCLMLLLGLRWLRHPPRDRDSLFSFRSELSLKSEETWRFAHRYIGKTWLRAGLILLVLTLVLMLTLRDYYAQFVLWLVAGQGILFAFSLLPTDGALLRAFGPELASKAEKPAATGGQASPEGGEAPPPPEEPGRE